MAVQVAIMELQLNESTTCGACRHPEADSEMLCVDVSHALQMHRPLATDTEMFAST